MTFRASVEAWRSLAEQFSSDAPVDFMLDWIDKESGGNRCNVTTSAGFREIGLFQLDDGNASMAGVDPDSLLSGCDGSTDDGSVADQFLAMSSGVDYIKALKSLVHQRLSDAGTDWAESTPDFWALVRLHHAAGSNAAAHWLSTATTALGRGPQNWNEYVSASGAEGNHWIAVSDENGAWGAGFVGGSSKWWITVLGLIGVGVGIWWYNRRAHRRIGQGV